MNIQPISDDDILVWPNGDWCFRKHRWYYTDRGEEFVVYPINSADWAAFMVESE